MKKVICIIGILVFITGLYSSAWAQKAEVRIKCATLMPKNAAPTFAKITHEIKIKTDNRVELKIYYGAAQGDEDSVLRKIRMGQLQGGSFSGHGLGEIVPEVRLLELPYLYENYEEVVYVLEGLKPMLHQRFDEQGYIVLGYFSIGFVYPFYNEPLNTVEGLRKQKWWMWKGDALQASVFKEMDVTPVSLSLTDVLTSLSSNLIDAAAAPPLAAISFRWHTKFKYMADYPITHALGGFVITKAIWEKVKVQDQKVILEIFEKNLKEADIKLIGASKKGISVLKKEGISFLHFNPQNEMEAFILKSAYKARQACVGKLYSQELLDKTLSLLDSVRKKEAKTN